MNGKISHLPRDIRDQLNQRLDDGEEADALIAWLNSLPEVQAILAAHFKGQPISRNNITNWKKHGFRKWHIRRTAVQFASELVSDNTAGQSLTDALSDKLAQWAAIRYAAAADALAGVEEDPETEMRHLREFCCDINTLRRGDLSAGRLALERQRLALLKAKSDEEKQTEFWEWTRRPEVQAKLYPHRDPEQTRRQVDRMISRHLLGIRYPDETPDESADPAALI